MSEYDPFSAAARRRRKRSAITGLALIGVGLIGIYSLPMLSYTHDKSPDNRGVDAVTGTRSHFRHEASRSAGLTDSTTRLQMAEEDPDHEGAETTDSLKFAPQLGIATRALPPSSGTAPDRHSNSQGSFSLSVSPSVRNKSVSAADANDTGTPVGSDAQAAVVAPYRHEGVSATTLEDGLAALCGRLALRVNVSSKTLCPAKRTLRLGHTGMSQSVMGQLRKGSASAPRVMVMAGVSGNQTAAVDTVLYWLDEIGATGDISWLVVPVVNPDGFLATPQRAGNYRGVMLTRNMPTQDWGHTASLAQPTSLQGSHLNPGSRGGSEAETTAVIASITAFTPDLIVEVGSGDGLVTLHGQGELTSDWTPLLTGYEPYSPGSLAQYASSERDIDVLKISLPSQQRAPSPGVRRQILEHLRQFIRSRYSQPAQS